MRLFTLLLPWLLLAALLSCSGSNQSNRSACPEDLICTEQFEMLQVQVLQHNGVPVMLDSFRSIHLETGQQWNLQEQESFETEQGFYLLLTDAQRREIDQEGSQIIFKGYKHGQTLVEETFLIGHDCCHIRLLSGVQEIRLEESQHD